MAFKEHRRSASPATLARDENLEVTGALYPPLIELAPGGYPTEGDLPAGADPVRPGAIAVVSSPPSPIAESGGARLAVYQGNGTWKEAGGGAYLQDLQQQLYFLQDLLASKEDNANRRTAVAPTSADHQTYPTTKAVQNAIGPIRDDVNGLSAALPTREATANRRTSLDGANHQTYPTTKAVADGLRGARRVLKCIDITNDSGGDWTPIVQSTTVVPAGTLPQMGWNSFVEVRLDGTAHQFGSFQNRKMGLRLKVSQPGKADEYAMANGLPFSVNMASLLFDWQASFTILPTGICNVRLAQSSISPYGTGENRIFRKGTGFSGISMNEAFSVSLEMFRVDGEDLNSPGYGDYGVYGILTVEAVSF